MNALNKVLDLVKKPVVVNILSAGGGAALAIIGGKMLPTAKAYLDAKAADELHSNAVDDVVVETVEEQQPSDLRRVVKSALLIFLFRLENFHEECN